MVTVRVCSKLKTSWKPLVFANKVWRNSRYFAGVFNKTIIPLALVGYDMIIANSVLRTSLALYHLISNAHSWNNCSIHFIILYLPKDTIGNLNKYFNSSQPFDPNISIHILNTVAYTLHQVLIRRIWLPMITCPRFQDLNVQRPWKLMQKSAALFPRSSPSYFILTSVVFATSLLAESLAQIHWSRLSYSVIISIFSRPLRLMTQWCFMEKLHAENPWWLKAYELL